MFIIIIYLYLVVFTIIIKCTNAFKIKVFTKVSCVLVCTLFVELQISGNLHNWKNNIYKDCNKKNNFIIVYIMFFALYPKKIQFLIFQYFKSFFSTL